jgi:WD40 repeat protein
MMKVDERVIKVEANFQTVVGDRQLIVLELLSRHVAYLANLKSQYTKDIDLNIYGSSILNTRMLEGFMFARIIRLNLKYCDSLDDSSILVIHSNLQHFLQRLELKGLKKLTAFCSFSIFGYSSPLSFHYLDYLNISDCDSLEVIEVKSDSGLLKGMKLHRNPKLQKIAATCAEVEIEGSLLVKVESKYQLDGTLKGHHSRVSCLLALPNGLLSSGGLYDNTVRIWDVNTLELKHTLSGHTGEIIFLAVESNRLLASGSRDFSGNVKIWNLQNFELRHTLSIRAVDRYSRAVFLSDCLLAVGLISGLPSEERYVIEIWNVETAQLIHTLTTSHRHGFVCFCVLPNGLLVSASLGDVIEFWDTSSYEMKHTVCAWHGPRLKGQSITVLPDGKFVTRGGSEWRIWNSSTFELVARYFCNPAHVCSLAVLSNGDVVGLMEYEEEINIWDMTNGFELVETIATGSKDKSSVWSRQFTEVVVLSDVICFPLSNWNGQIGVFRKWTKSI